mmetsp:Transcript_3492/g.8799  ORF Transcript_3492/g.8799 Transcript_3492/m.8799 type:complete len:380 (-) Transcript_3492:87-1226(-)
MWRHSTCPFITLLLSFAPSTCIFNCDAVLSAHAAVQHPLHARCGSASADQYIAVGFYGLAYRGLDVTLHAIERHCFQVLCSHGISFDVLVHTYFVLSAHASGSNDSHLVPLDPYAVVRLRPCVLEMEDQATVLDDIQRRIAAQGVHLQDLWRDGLRSVHSYLLALRSLSRLTAVMRTRSVGVGREYDAVLLLRADTLLTCDVDVPQLIPVLRSRAMHASGGLMSGLVCTPVWGTFGGVNDRLLLGTANATFHLIAHREVTANKLFARGTHPQNGEALLASVLASLRVERCRTSMVVQRVRPHADGKHTFDIPRLDTLAYLRDELTYIRGRLKKTAAGRNRKWWRTAGKQENGVTAHDVCDLAAEVASTWNHNHNVVTVR